MTAKIAYDERRGRHRVAGAVLPGDPRRHWCGTPGPRATSTRSTGTRGSPIEVGLPDVIAHGMFTMAEAVRVVTDWVGDPGAVVEYGVRFTKPVVVPNDDKGALIEVSAKVGAKLDEPSGAGRPDGDVRRPEGAGHGPCGGQAGLTGRWQARRGQRARVCPPARNLCLGEPGGTSWLGSPCRANGLAPTSWAVLVGLARAGTPRRPPRPPDHLPARRPRGPADHRDDRRRGGRGSPRGRTSGAPLLVIGGGSNLVIGDKGFAGTALRIATRGFELDGTRAGAGGRRGLDGRRGPYRRRRARGHRVPGRNPGFGGRHPDPERRCVRPGGLLHDHRGGRLRPHAPARTVDPGERRLRLLLPAQPLQGRPRALSWCCGSASSWRTRTACRRPVKYAETARVLGVEAGDRVPAATARETVLKLRAGKGMVLDPEDHDTWSRRVLLHQPDPRRGRVRRLPRAGRTTGSARTAAPPAFPAGEGHIKTSAAWLIDRAGFTKGYGTGPARISTKHTLALTNRGGATTEDLLALAREVVDGGARRRSG